MAAISDVVRSTAPGKIILLGEHAVVYGRAALAASIDRQVEVAVAPAGGPARLAALASSSDGIHWPVPIEALQRAAALTGVNAAEIETVASANLPFSAGLGSSAALSVALIRSLARFSGQSLTNAVVCAHAFEIEKLFHGFPSGIDNTVVTYGGLLAFRHGTAPRPVTLKRPIPLVIGIGRTARETQKTVRGLRQRWEADQGQYDPLFDQIDALVGAAESAIGMGEFAQLGALMDANHELLQRMGISTDELDQMVGLARASGARGAKLTGGGGGGAVICLCDGDRDRLVEAFTQSGWKAFSTDIKGPKETIEAGDDAVRFEPCRSARA
jgi:hydroxymethylglutaryl-CoA reductase